MAGAGRVKSPGVIRFPIERRRPRPASDRLLERMKARGLPLTHEVYLELNFPDGVPDPLPGEIEAAIPEELQ